MKRIKQNNPAQGNTPNLQQAPRDAPIPQPNQPQPYPPIQPAGYQPVMQYPDPKKNRRGFVKSLLLLLFLIASSFFFGWVCKQMQVKYDSIFHFNLNLLWLMIWVLVSIILVIIFSGLVAAFVQPKWLAFLYFFVSAATILLVWGINLFSGIASLLYLLLAIVYTLEIKRVLQNQVNFHISAINGQQKFIQMGLTVLIALSFALGFRQDALVSNFALPPELKQTILNFIVPIMQSTAENAGIPGEASNAISSMTQTSLDQIWAQIENTLKPIATILPFIGGLLIFSIIQLLFLVLSRLTAILEGLLLGFLRAIGFIREEKQMKEINQLML